MFRPSFNKGRILKQNMLEALRDFPYEVLKVMYSSYGDGIISGFDVDVLDGHGNFRVSPGILKINQEIYISPCWREENLNSDNDNIKEHYVYLKKYADAYSDGDEIKIKPVLVGTESSDEGLELFRCTKYAYSVMFKYKNIDELFKEQTVMNRINQVFCKYAVIGGSTLHPYYFKLFADKVLKSSNPSPPDTAFAYQCLNGISNIDVVNRYFNIESPLSNVEILKLMENVIKKLDNSSEKQTPIKNIGCKGPSKLEIS